MYYQRELTDAQQSNKNLSNKICTLCTAGNAHAHTWTEGAVRHVDLTQHCFVLTAGEHRGNTEYTLCTQRKPDIPVPSRGQAPQPHTEHREHSQIHSLLTQINTIHTFFFLVLLGCFCVECSNQICRAYRTYPNDNQPPIVHRNIAFFSTDDRSDEFTETKCSSITENYGLCTVQDWFIKNCCQLVVCERFQVVHL